MTIDPSHHGLDQLLAQIDKLPTAVQLELHQALSTRISKVEKHDTKAGTLKAGWAKGLITIGADFDEPLEEFKEYMD